MKFNKISACLAAVACTASMFSVMSVSAADSVTITAGSATAKAGENFTVDIKLSGVPSTGIAGLDFEIAYDSSVIEVTGVKEGSISKTNDKQVEGFSSNLETDLKNGKVSVLWATGQIKTNDTWIKSDGVLLTLECKALKDGTSNIEITKPSRGGATAAEVAVEGLKVVSAGTSKGSVTVGSDTTTIKYGDVNKDGDVDLSDLTMLSQYTLKDITLTGDALKAGDCNGDGEVDIRDIALLKQFVMNDKVTLGPQ